MICAPWSRPGWPLTIGIHWRFWYGSFDLATRGCMNRWNNQFQIVHQQVEQYLPMWGWWRHRSCCRHRLHGRPWRCLKCSSHEWFCFSPHCGQWGVFGSISRWHFSQGQTVFKIIIRLLLVIVRFDSGKWYHKYHQLRYGVCIRARFELIGCGIRPTSHANCFPKSLWSVLVPVAKHQPFFWLPIDKHKSLYKIEIWKKDRVRKNVLKIS